MGVKVEQSHVNVNVPLVRKCSFLVKTSGLLKITEQFRLNVVLAVCHSNVLAANMGQRAIDKRETKATKG